MIWTLALLPALAGLAIWAGPDGRVRAGASGAAALAVTVLLALAAGDWTGSYGWSHMLVLRASLMPLSHAVAVMVPTIALAVVIFAASHEEKRGLSRLIGLLVVFVGGMELIVMAGDLLTLLIGWEIVGACSWALITHHWRQGKAAGSANYAFVMTRAGDLGLFLALFATFSATGGLSYGALSDLQGPPLWIAALGILVAAASKAGQVPFSPWLFRAMDGPTSVSALLHSAAMVAAGAYLVARLQPQLSDAPGFGAAAIAVGLVTAIAGGLVALRQVHAKKVLAGSTSAQLGLMFAAAGAGYPGVAAIHLIVHAAFKASLFFAAGIAHAAAGSFDLRTMRLGRALPWTAALTGVGALALAGVPPLSGAWSKEEVVKTLGHAGPWLAIAGMAAGGLSAAYAARFALLAYGPGDRSEAARPGRGETAALAGLALLTVALSALWLPPVHEAAAGALGVALPSGSAIETTVSLMLVALGLLAGVRLARQPAPAPRQDWLGLAGLIERTFVLPFGRAADAAARIDDRTLDAIPRAVAALAMAVSGWAARVGETALDGLAAGTTDRAVAHGARTWHGALALIVEATAALAGSASRSGEAASDLIAGGTGRLAGMAGGDLRRLQTGQSHHYYTLLVAGFAAGLAILIMGA